MAELTVGKKAPAFTLTDQDGKKVKLSDFAGKKVVIYFYPKADTPGCTQQSCNLRDAMPNLKKLKAVVLGISADPPAKQKKFDDGNSLGYPLVSDESGEVASAYGVKRGLLGKLAPVKRKTFVIGTDGLIKAVIGSETKMAAHGDDSLKALAAL